MDIDEKALNEKLAKWAGFHEHEWEHYEKKDAIIPPLGNWEDKWYSRCKTCGFDIVQSDRDNNSYTYPDRSMWRILPFFIQSLDACFKYLVPKLIKENVWDIELKNSPYYPNQFQVVIERSLNPHLARYQAQSENPALALCLAIEQLVDKEKI